MLCVTSDTYLYLHDMGFFSSYAPNKDAIYPHNLSSEYLTNVKILVNWVELSDLGERRHLFSLFPRSTFLETFQAPHHI